MQNKSSITSRGRKKPVERQQFMKEWRAEVESHNTQLVAAKYARSI